MPRVLSTTHAVRECMLMDLHASTSDAQAVGQEHTAHSPERGRRRKKQRPRTWGRRMRARLMPLFWITVALVGLYFVVRSVLSMTALQ